MASLRSLTPSNFLPLLTFSFRNGLLPADNRLLRDLAASRPPYPLRTN